MRKVHYFVGLLGSLLMLSGLSLLPLMAQNQNTVITVGINEFQQQMLDDDLFDDFEAANPGVDVVPVVIPQDAQFFGTVTSSEGTVDYIENVNNLVERADLIPLQLFGDTRYLTRSGALLDITPLLNADPDADLDDFYPVLLESMRWDGGTWGLPLSGSVQIAVYNATAFDEAGLTYPDATWTFNDYLNAGMTLSQFNDEGELTLPGFFGFNPSVMFRATLGRAADDPAAFPSQPLVTDPEIVALAQQWQAYMQDYYPDFSAGPGLQFDFNDIPLTIGQTFRLNPEMMGPNNDGDWRGTLLPGGTAAVSVTGYAVSSGTANPELAYDLLQYMTRVPEISLAFFGDVAGRQSVTNAELGDDVQIFRPDTPPELQTLIDEALAAAFPIPEMFSFDLIQNVVVMGRDVDPDEDLETRLRDMQEDAIEGLNAVSEAASNNIVAVATPMPTPVLQAGEIALTLGIEGQFGQLENRDEWEQTMRDFAAQDPEIGQVTLDTEFMPLNQRVETQDCFYLSTNPVQSVDLALLLNLDPFINADPNFDPTDVLPGTLQQLSRDGGTWGLPLSVVPSVIWYNPTLFAEAGLPEPTNDWTIFEFEDALRALDAVTETQPYRSQDFNNVHLFALAGAYGGIPLDFSTQPFTINSDPASIEAAQSVLDLAKNDLMYYQELAANFGGGGGGFGGNQALFDAQLRRSDFRLENRRDGDPETAVRVVMFPRGTQYTPVAYTLNAGYISPQTPHPDACYRLLSHLSQQVSLFSGMPARQSLFDDATALIEDSSDVAAVYQAFSAALNEPNVVIYQAGFGNFDNPVAAISSFLRLLWVGQAFDNYVLNDIPLDESLIQAEQFVTEYETCVAPIAQPDRPFFELSPEEGEAFFNQYIDCAIDVDPRIAPRFGRESAE